MTAQSKFPWTKLIAPFVGAACGVVLVLVIDSESWMPMLLVPVFSLIAWGVDRLLSAFPEQPPPGTDLGWRQAGQPAESGWYQAGRPVEQGGYPQAPPEPSQSIWAAWREAGLSAWDRFLVSMVGPSRRLNENARNALIGFGFIAIIVVFGALYFAFNSEDLATFGNQAVSVEAKKEESVKEIKNEEVAAPQESEKQSVLKPDRFVKNELVYPQNGHMYKYTNLLPVGIEAGVAYGFGDFDDIRKLVESVDVNFAYIKCSMRAAHDSDAWQACSYSAENEVSPSGYWRLAYYPKINQTWLEVVTRGFDQDGKRRTWVTILKAARGKRPNLNIE
ncbi:MAG TPA: hypothetical protein PKY05_12460 [Fibrobacteria bacterium]|nr:hypothetical protein [Fibrobacteria bacterium]